MQRRQPLLVFAIPFTYLSDVVNTPTICRATHFVRVYKGLVSVYTCTYLVHVCGGAVDAVHAAQVCKPYCRKRRG